MPDKSMLKTKYVTTFLSLWRSLPRGLLAAAALSLCMPAAAEEEKITVNFVNADIQSVIKAVGQQTGKNFILDPRVTGTVNIVSDRPVSKDLLYQIFLSALRVQDYAENVRRIQRIIQSIDLPAAGDVQIVRLQNASAIDIAQILQRVIPETSPLPSAPGSPPKAAVAVDPRTNSLLVRGDNPALIARIKALAAGLDTPGAGAGNIFVVPLRNAEAVKIAETLRALLAGTGAEAARVTTTAAPTSGIPGAPTAATSASSPVYRNLRSENDKLDERRALVFVEALVVELAMGRAAEFGVQWQGLSNLGNSTRGAVGGTNFSTSPTGATGTNILGATGILGTLANIAQLGPGLNIGVVNGTISVPQADGTTITIANLGVLARAFEGATSANVLSTPNILTLDNQEAKLLVGQNVPFITGSSASTAGTGPHPIQTIERRGIRHTLRRHHQISDAGTLKLAIFQEVSSATRDQSLAQSAALITNKRVLASNAAVDDG